ncbi:MAG TPA: hypothetical protein EYN69_14415 [Flavobacteriales bacterium]|nr:hypothetical protein [Flavobacteriales bacterium]
MNILRTVSAGFFVATLFSCSSEVKELVQEPVEEGAPTPLVVQASKDLPAKAPNESGNSIDENGLLIWYLDPEANAAEYRVQQHRWNKWVDIGGLDSAALKGDHYEFEVKLLAGQNIFWVRKKGISKKRVTPVEVFKKLEDLNKSVSWAFNAEETAIVLTEECMYEIFNEAGALVDKGTASEIDISGFATGGYYFNYALFMDSFQKK